VSDKLFSEQWYKVAELKPRLSKHVKIHRHVYRDQVWFVLQDELTGSNNRFSASAQVIIAELDGEQTMQAIWEKAVIGLGEEAPTQAETIQLLGQLHAADALVSGVSADTMESFERYQKQRSSKFKQKFANPMSIRIPLIDPERFLVRHQGVGRWLFGPWGLAIWLVLFLVAGTLSLLHWQGLTENIRDTILTPSNLLLMALIFPLVKALHELGHALAVKAWGGQVHEMGIMLLIFMPVPYVDASSSAVFRESYKRIIVSAAGIMVEVAIAAIALIVWVYSDPSVLRTLAYNTIIIAGVSTLFFNANPLLRFDGYYMLADALAIPNLYGRAQKYFTYLLKSRLLGLPGEISPIQAKGELRWFLSYGVLSYVYRVFIAVTIALFIASHYFFIGILLAMWSLFSLIVLPIGKAVWFLFTDPRIKRKSIRTPATVLGVSGVLVLLLGFVPVPHWTNAEGVVWLPENTIVRSGIDCFVTELLVAQGAEVSKGQVIARCQDPFLQSSIAVKKAAVDEHFIRYLSAREENATSTKLASIELKKAKSELTLTQDRVADLDIKSASAGRIDFLDARDLVGKFVHQGDMLAYVIPQGSPEIRAVVDQQGAQFVRNQTHKIELRRVSQIDSKVEAKLVRELPGASEYLPSNVLGSAGGGALAIDPSDPEGVKTFDRVFQFQVQPIKPLDSVVFNERVYLRFYHDNKSLFERWLLWLRLILLNELEI